MVDRSSSKRCVPIRIRLAVYFFIIVKCYKANLFIKIRAINLIGKEFSCRESRYRIVADIARLILIITEQTIFNR